MTYPYDPSNCFVRFIGPNPATSFQPELAVPHIDSSAFVGAFTSIIGAGSNLQDGVILHGLNVYIATNATVTGNVMIADHRFVPPDAVIDTQAKADLLGPIPRDKKEFAEEVQRVNREFSESYSMMLGSKRCSCGMAYE